MTLKQMSDTLILWANSCITPQQLTLVDHLIEGYAIDRFRGHPELANEVCRIMTAIQEKAKKIGREDFQPISMN